MTQFPDQLQGFLVAMDHSFRQSQPAHTWCDLHNENKERESMDSSLQKHLPYRKKNTANSGGSGLALYCSHILRVALLNELEDICPEARVGPSKGEFLL